MKSLWIPFALLPLVLASGSAHAINCKEAVATIELDQCAQQELDIAENRLNQAYQQILKKLSQPDDEVDEFSKEKRKLIEAQRAWVKFRQLDCDAVYTFYSQGSVRNMMFIHCMRQHADRRMKDLTDTYGSR